MAIEGYSMGTLDAFVGKELGVSAWTEVDQARIDAFAQCTGDRQWIHVDVERARRESPFGGTIAHGYLTLSLLAGKLVDMADDRSLLDLVALAQELEELLERPVDVLTEQSLAPAIRERVTANAQPL